MADRFRADRRFLDTILDDAIRPKVEEQPGPDTDGQILVLYDVLDITPGRKPRFVRNFMEGARDNLDAVRARLTGVYPVVANKS